VHGAQEAYVPLSIICREGGVSRRWYKEQQRRRRVPGWYDSRSLGRGKGRRYLYPKRRALQAIREVRAALEAGQTPDKLQGRWWFDGKEHFGQERELVRLARRIAQGCSGYQRCGFVFCVQSAADLGAFGDCDLVAGKSGCRVRFRDDKEEEDFLDELRRMYEVYRMNRPGDSVMFALVRKQIRDFTFERASVDPEENPEEGEKLERMLASLGEKERTWASWPGPLKRQNGTWPGGRPGMSAS
jgi:hypothetical protein